MHLLGRNVLSSVLNLNLCCRYIFSISPQVDQVGSVEAFFSILFASSLAEFDVLERLLFLVLYEAFVS